MPYVPPREGISEDGGIWDCSYRAAACGARSASPFGLLRVSRREDVFDVDAESRVEVEGRVVAEVDGRGGDQVFKGLYCECCSCSWE